MRNRCLTHKELVEAMNRRNKIQEDITDYDIIVEGTIEYKVVGLEDSPTPDEEQIQDGEEKIFKQLDDLANDRDYIDDTFEQDGVAKGQAHIEFSDQEIDNNKIYCKVNVSTKGATTDIKAQDIADSLAQILKDLDANTEIESVTGWSNDEEDVESTYVKLKLIGEPETKILKDTANQSEKDNVKESKFIDTIDRELVMKGRLDFIKENSMKSIILNDDGIMELYENNNLIDSKPFSKLGIQRECKSIFQEGYSTYIKLQEDIKSDEIKDSNGDNVDLDQTKQNIEQSIEKVDELQDLKNELQDKVDNLYNESKVEEEKVDKFISTPFTKKLLNSEEIYNLKPEEELTVEQVAYITNLFGSLDDFMDSLKQLTEMVALSPDIHFISIDEYVQEMEREFNKEVI